MEDTDPDLIDEICGQDENAKNDFEKGRRRWWMGPDLIFVTNITNNMSGEKIVMWRNFKGVKLNNAMFYKPLGPSENTAQQSFWPKRPVFSFV